MFTRPVRIYRALLLSFILITAAFLAITSDWVIKTTKGKAADIKGNLGTWDLVDSPVSVDLKSVAMVSKNNGWIVGNGGTILHWDGNSWSTVVSPTTQALFAVKMISATNGWAVGAYGKILHWDGASWSLFSSPTDASLYSMDFLSSSEGWAVGFSSPCTNKRMGTILKWNGSQWSSIVEDVNDIGYRTVEALSSDNVWVIGTYQQASCISPIFYPDQLDVVHWNGQLWNNKIAYQCNDWINSLALMPDSTGWAGGYICMAAFDPSDNGTLHQVPVGISGEITVVSIQIVAADDVWAVGGDYTTASDKSLILHWDGSVWSPIPNTGAQPLSSVSMISANDGWAVGRQGTIFHYTNYTTTYTYLPLAIR
jgi:photosystem II stability/assembly factor-like uncharacterized protein